jgi:hypothetical protein
MLLLRYYMVITIQVENYLWLFLEVWGKCFLFTTITGRPEMAESGVMFGHIILMKNDAFVSFGYGLF